MFPVHTWLPDAHVEAPTGGSVILAAILLKMGGYGFLRFSLPVTPDASMSLDWLIIGLSLIAVVYIGFVALVQADMKKLIAYSSIAHMGFVTLGFFLAYSIQARTGTRDKTGGHGIITGRVLRAVLVSGQVKTLAIAKRISDIHQLRVVRKRVTNFPGAVQQLTAVITAQPDPEGARR